MLIAPATALLGILPYVFLLNLTLTQALLSIVAATLLCYIGGLVLGAPGYFALRALGRSQSIYLMSYAALLVIATAYLFKDVYVLVSLGPPILLAAGAFCVLRGAPMQTAAD